MQPNITRKPYKSDLTDDQWSLLEPLIELPDGGRPRTANLREVVNAIIYQLKTGCQWDMLPHDFPPRRNGHTLFSFFQKDQSIRENQ